MTNLLVIREVLKKLFAKYEAYVMPISKGLLAFIVLNIININIGYMERVNNVILVLMVAVLCSFLPVGFTMLFSAFFVLLHLYELGIEMAGMGAILFAIIYFMFLRFSPKDALVLILIPILYLWKIPVVIPLAVGLIATPMSIVSVGCGVVIYFFLEFISTNAIVLREMGTEDMISKVRMVIDGMIHNNTMFVILASFSAVVLIVYIIRKLAIDHAWTIAIIVGGIVNVLVIMMGDLMLSINENILWLLFGTILSVVFAKVLEFFIFNVDYTRAERVQFEDDDYYYYVKAIPKVTMPTTTKTVKQINSRTGTPMRNEGVRVRSGKENGAVSDNRQTKGAAPSQMSQRRVTVEKTKSNVGEVKNNRKDK